MGVRLIVEVLDHAPKDLSPAEVAVLIAVAEEANDVTREAWPGIAKLARRARLEPDSVRRVLQRLRDRKLELRVPIGVDKNGSPFFAARGRCTIYRVPVFSVGERRDEGPTIPTERRDGQPPMHPERRDAGPGFRPERRDGDPALPLSKELLLQQQASKIVTSQTDADEVEARAVVAAVVAEKRPGNLMGFLTRLGRDGELPAWVERVRARAGRAGRDEWLAELDRQPGCEHGYPGGHVPDGDGWVRCPIERNRRSRGVA